MWGWVVVLVAVIGGLSWFMVSSENAEMARFMDKCLAIPKSQAECELLAEIKSSADSAQLSSSLAVGMAAGSVGRR